MKATLYIRIKLESGKRSFVKPVYAANRKLKPLYAIVNKKPEHHPEGVYYLRCLQGKKQRWEPVGSDPQAALLRQHQREASLNAQRAGIQVVESVTTGRDLDAAIDEYLANVGVSKSAMTYVQYEYVLRVFAMLCRKPLEGIMREDILILRDYFLSRGNAGCSISHHLTNVRTFLTYFDRPWPLKKTDRVKPIKKIVSAYSHEEIDAMLSVATEDEADLVWFLLGTGARKQECMFATWGDVDFVRGTFKVSLKLDHTPKDKEEGVIPIPDELRDRLRVRKADSTNTRIFPLSMANAEKQLLGIIKGLALRAGLNCGECHHKPSMSYPHGRSCTTAPICERYILHKFRKSFATWHSEAGVPVRTIQRWLRHSNLETTLKYLAGSDDQTEQTRSRVNSAFATIRRRVAA
ncbi:MAG: tyrosine-type recombinase/integrase [Terracidiphilus sp.]|jgi:integrase